MTALLFDGVPFTIESACISGLNGSRLQRLLQRGAIRRVVHGAYVDARVPDSLLVRASALALVLPKGVVVCRSTAALAARDRRAGDQCPPARRRRWRSARGTGPPRSAARVSEGSARCCPTMTSPSWLASRSLRLLARPSTSPAGGNAQTRSPTSTRCCGRASSYARTCWRLGGVGGTALDRAGPRNGRPRRRPRGVEHGVTDAAALYRRGVPDPGVPDSNRRRRRGRALPPRLWGEATALRTSSTTVSSSTARTRSSTTRPADDGSPAVGGWSTCSLASTYSVAASPSRRRSALRWASHRQSCPTGFAGGPTPIAASRVADETRW